MSNPKRSEVAKSDTWDLTSLFPNDEAWQSALPEFDVWLMLQYPSFPQDNQRYYHLHNTYKHLPWFVLSGS